MSAAPIIFTTFDHVASPKPNGVMKMEWRELADMLGDPLERPQGDLVHALPQWSPVRFEGKRAKKNAREVTAIVLDIDGGTSFGRLREALDGRATLITSTKRATEEQPRWRIVLPVSRSMTPNEYEHVWNAFASELAQCGVDVDRQGADIAHAWFGSVVAADGTFIAQELDGDPIDVDALLIEEPEPKSERKSKREEGITEGHRNAELTSMAGRMRREGATKEEIAKKLHDVNASDVLPPLPANEIESIAGSVSQYNPTPAQTDVGNGQRFAKEHGAIVRFVLGRGRWLVFDGVCWREDANDVRVTALAKKTARAMYLAAADIDDEEGDTLAKHARRTQSRGGLASMIALAASEPGIAIETKRLDVDPWLLNCANGTLDLRTGKLRKHHANDLITRALEIPFDANAKCPTFEKFLRRVQPSKRLRRYLQRVIGYCLTGSTDEHAMFVLYGIGANGKSVLTRTIADLLGAYAKPAMPNVLFSARSDRHPTEIAHFAAARVVFGSEIPEGRALEEDRVKWLTGGDPITARGIGENPWTFNPTHKIFVSGNHRPEVRGVDEGIWRRIKLVPFGVVIPADERDLDLASKLRKELPGILAWAVRGCLRWQRIGLREPSEVKEATKDYRSSSDVVESWISACCARDTNGITPASALHRSFCDWAKSHNERPLSQRAFGDRLRLKNFSRLKNGTIVWSGIRLQSIDEGTS